MSRVAAFIAGLGTGYMQQSERERDRARQEKRDAMEQERHDAFLSDRAEKKATKERLRAAAAPLEVETPNDVTKDDDGNNMPAVPAFRVGGTRYDTRDAAEGAAKAGNTSAASMARKVGAMEAEGDYAGAAQMRAADVQTRAAELKLAQEQFMADAGTALMQDDFDGLAGFMSKSRADGNDYKAVREGGKVVVMQVNRETGQARPLKSYEDSETGRRTAFVDLISSVKPEQAMAHWRFTQQQAQQAEQFAATGERQDRQHEETKRSNLAREGIAREQVSVTRENAAETRKLRESQTLSGKVGALETALGRKFEGEERDKVVLKLAGLGKDDESINKFANSVVQEGVKGGTIDPKNVGAARQQVIASIKQANQDAETARVISTELGAAKGDSTKYTQTYEKVLKIPGVTAEYLTSIGYPPPAKLKPPAPKPMASAGIPRPRVSFGPVTEGAANAQDR